MKKFGNFLIKVGFVVMLLAVGTMLVYELPGLKKWITGGIGFTGILIGGIGFFLRRENKPEENEDDYYKYIGYR